MTQKRIIAEIKKWNNIIEIIESEKDDIEKSNLISEEIVLEKWEAVNGLVLSKDRKTLIKAAENLKECIIPNSVKEIENKAFAHCTSLTSITLHDNYNEVKECDFSCCSSLSSITLPSTVTKIGEYAFCECSSLTSLNLENIKEYGYCCFIVFSQGVSDLKPPGVWIFKFKFLFNGLRQI